MNKKNMIMVAILVFVIIVAVFAVGQDWRFGTNSSLIRQCPDTWNEDRMPSDKPHVIYLTFDDISKDSSAYDVDWIEGNCPSTQFNISN